LHKTKYLLDVNVLIALTEEGHEHHKAVTRWFATPGLDWGVCAFSEAGLLRISMNPNVGNLSEKEAIAMLATLTGTPGYRFWPMTTGWIDLAAPFRDRLFGHQQVADAYLLGLAVKENGVLISLDRAILYLAGPQYRKHLLVLES
jgi:uncharacterized protein